jgi:hypothetical protein
LRRAGLAAAVLVPVLVLVLPLGPDVSVAKLEASVLEESVPRTQPDVSADCIHAFWTTASWSCAVTVHVPVLRDQDSDYDVKVDDAGCWRGELEEADLSSRIVRPRRIRGCLK